MGKYRGISRTGPLGVFLALLGYWGAWVDHKTAALVLSGLDMGEYVKFLPEVREGSLIVLRELFYLPPLAAALCLALLVSRLGSRYPSIVRVLMLGLAVGLCLVVMPPYPFVLHALSSAEFREQFILSVLCLLLIAASPLCRHLTDRCARLMLIVLALLGTLPALAQFCVIRPALERAYGWPLQIGWGIWVMIVGFAFVIAAGAENRAGSADTPSSA